MKKVILFSLFIVLFLVGCKEDPVKVVDKEIFGEIPTAEEIIVTKYLNNINNYECKYYLDSEASSELITILKSLVGRETVLGGSKLLFKYDFTIGDLRICVANDLCHVNGKDYKISYDFDTYFDKFEAILDDSNLSFSDIVSTEGVGAIDITKIKDDGLGTELYLREDDKVEEFLENMNATKWNEVKEVTLPLIYKIEFSKVVIEIYITDDNVYYMKINDKYYKTNGTLEFLDLYNKENTDDNSSGFLPWI